MKICWTALLLCTAFCHSILAQSLIPIGSAISSNQVSYTANTSFDIGSIQDVFDGDENTLARTPSVNPLIITLTLPSSIPLLKSRLHSATDAAWTVEVATSLNDLDAQSGSYNKVIDARAMPSNTWDEATISSVASKYVRLTILRTTGDDYVHLSEWELYGPTPVISSLIICPATYFLAPGFSKTIRLSGVDSYGLTQTLTTGITWSSGNTSIATVDNMGNVTAVSVGTTTISAAYENITATADFAVGRTFTPVNAEKKTVKVALVFEDPYIPGSSTVRWHERFNWNNPAVIAADLIAEMNAVSGNTVEFVATQTIYSDIQFTRFDGSLVDSSFFYHRYETSEGLDELLYWAGHLSNYRLRYDYVSLLNHYNFCQQRENGTIDEVWVLSHPAGGMHESTLAGPNAFWYNSSPVEGSSCVKLLPIMGFNNSVGLDNAIHSFGHRMESTMSHVYGGWHPEDATPQSPWDLYTWLDKDHPDKSQVGNIHYCSNSLADYAYGETNYVINFADNWSHYPLMGNTARNINCAEWDCTQLGYMRWWFGHLPKFKGISEGVLNDWWHYLVHYEEAVEIAHTQYDDCDELPYEVISGSNVAPDIAILNPLDAATYNSPATISVTALTSDNDGFVSKVEFFSNGNKIGESTSAPFKYEWTNVSGGTYELTAKAWDNNGASTTSDAVTVIVDGVTGTNNTAANSKHTLNAYPNPLADILRIEIPSQGGVLEILDAQGRKLYTAEVKEGLLEIPSQRWSAGVYLLQLQQVNGERIVRMVVK